MTKNIEPKYKIGDIVHCIASETKIEKTTCDCCGGKGSVPGLNEHLVPCYKCQTGGTLKKYLKPKWKIQHDSSIVGNEIFGMNIARHGNTLNEKYLCTEKYGKSWFNIKDIFSDIKEAIQECERRNRDEDNHM